MSEQNETCAEKRVVWFVQEGQMNSGWIIGQVDINVSVEDSESYTGPDEVLQNVLAKDAENIVEHDEHTKAISRHVRLHDFTKRPGRWYFLSGMSVVHVDDCYTTRAGAAEAYKNFLLGDEYNG